MINRRYYIKFLWIFFVLISGFGSLKSYADSAPIIVNVGIYAPFSGEFSMVGRSMFNGMSLANKNLNNHRYQYVFYILDQSADQAEAQRLNQFIKDKNISILISEGSVGGKLSKSAASEHKILHVSLASDPAIADGTYNFLAWSPASTQGALVAKELVKKHIHTVGLIRVDHPWATVIGDAFIDALKKTNIKVAMNARFKAGTTDYSSIISEMKKSNPNIFFIMGFQQDMLALRHAMTAANIKTPITGVIERLSPAVKEVFNDQWYVDTRDMNPIFVSEYEKNYQQTPVTEGGYAYDVFTWIAESMNAVGDGQKIPSLDGVSKKFKSLKGEGIMGPFYIKPDGIVVTDSVVKTVHDGKVTIVN